MKFDFDLTGFMQTQQKKNNRIISWEYFKKSIFLRCFFAYNTHKKESKKDFEKN